MAMILGTDPEGRVLLVNEAQGVESMPAEHNGVPITAHLLTDEQAAEFQALPPDRGGTVFDGKAMTAMPAPKPKEPTRPLMDLVVEWVAKQPDAPQEIKDAAQSIKLKE